MLRVLLRFALAAAIAVTVAPVGLGLSGAAEDGREITAERRAVFAKEDFDGCTLISPEETWAYFDTVLSDQDKNTISETPYTDLFMFHLGWGMKIRNNFCLWTGGSLKQWFASRGVQHPEGMSGILIGLYWAHLNGCRPDSDAFARSLGYNPEFLHCPAAVQVR